MTATFPIEVFSLTSSVLRADASEVVLPAYDGQVGILPNHGDFAGVLGTGVLQVKSETDSLWFLVEGGFYQVNQGRLALFVDRAEKAADIDLETVSARAQDLAEALNDPQRCSPETYDAQRLEYRKELARIEVAQSSKGSENV